MTDAEATHRALWIAVFYKLHCQFRRRPGDLRGFEVLQRAVQQAARDLTRGHTAAMRVMDNLWARGAAGAEAASCPQVLTAPSPASPTSTADGTTTATAMPIGGQTWLDGSRERYGDTLHVHGLVSRAAGFTLAARLALGCGRAAQDPAVEIDTSAEGHPRAASPGAFVSTTKLPPVALSNGST